MISPASFNIFKSTINTMVGQAYSTTPTHYQRFCTTLPSSSSQQVYGWTGMLAKPRLWTGPRVTIEAAPQTYTVVNLPYEETVAIDRFELDDDQYGIYYRILPDLARQTKRLPDYWVRDLLENVGIGAQTPGIQNGFDGLTAFNTAHPVDLYNAAAGTYSNDFTGGGMTIGGQLVGGAFGVTALATLREYMRSFKAEDQERMGIVPDLVMIPVQLELEAELIVKSMFMAPPAWATVTGQVGAADNPMRRFGLEVMVNELLISNTKWYLMDTTKALKPLIWQVREAPRMVPRVNENDPMVIDEHRFSWNAWGRAAPGWGFSWLFTRSGP